MRKFLKWLLLLVFVSLTIFVVAFALDRLLWSLPCPPCHTELTRALPLLDRSTVKGLVRIRAAGFHFRARVAGLNNRDGEGVILLHGYPETSIMWESTLALLAANGFRAVAFDQRGYSPAARPGSISSYSIDEIASDVIAIADGVGFDRFHLVGHDWGGVVGWTAADRYPNRVATWTALSMPHPAAFSEALSQGNDQLRRSSYVLLNWIPGLAEFVLGFNRAAYLQRFSWGLMSASQREEYVRVFSEPGALRGVLNWYRANNLPKAQDVGKTRQPTLYIWGNQDKSLGRIGAEKTADYVKGPYRFIKLAVGHQLMAEVPDRVSREVLSHLTNWKIKDLPRLSPIPNGDSGSAGDNCTPSKPHCLQINISPAGNISLARPLIQITNRCSQRYTGTITLRCTGWQQKVSIAYQFDLGPRGALEQTIFGLVHGDCYYDQKVCSTEGQAARHGK